MPPRYETAATHYAAIVKQDDGGTRFVIHLALELRREVCRGLAAQTVVRRAMVIRVTPGREQCPGLDKRREGGYASLDGSRSNKTL